MKAQRIIYEGGGGLKHQLNLCGRYFLGQIQSAIQRTI